MSIEYKILEILPGEFEHRRGFADGTCSTSDHSTYFYLRKEDGKYEIGYESPEDYRCRGYYFIRSGETLTEAITAFAKCIVFDITEMESYDQSYSRGSRLFLDGLGYKELKEQLEVLLKEIDDR